MPGEASRTAVPGERVGASWLCAWRGARCQAPSRGGWVTWSSAFSAGSFIPEASSPPGLALPQDAWPAASDPRSPPSESNSLALCLRGALAPLGARGDQD